MPYVKQADRDALDSAIDNLAEKIAGRGVRIEDHAGLINYSVTRLILTLIGEAKYWKIALVCGVLHNIVTEFYRKYAVPYEDKKIAENGDVYPGQ